MPCGSGKIEHLTRDAALEHLKSLVWQNHSRGESEKSQGLNVYPCDECGAWYVGHGDSGPVVYHYTLIWHLDAILESGVLRARRPRAIDKRALRGLSKRQREAVTAMEEPDPLLWFSRNPDWEYSVIKTLLPKQGRRIGGVFAAGVPAPRRPASARPLESRDDARDLRARVAVDAAGRGGEAGGAPTLLKVVG